MAFSSSDAIVVFAGTTWQFERFVSTCFVLFFGCCNINELRSLPCLELGNAQLLNLSRGFAERLTLDFGTQYPRNCRLTFCTVECGLCSCHNRQLLSLSFVIAKGLAVRTCSGIFLGQLDDDESARRRCSTALCYSFRWLRQCNSADAADALRGRLAQMPPSLLLREYL